MNVMAPVDAVVIETLGISGKKGDDSARPLETSERMW